MMTKAIAKLIQSEQTHMIPSQMQMGREQGMCLLDQSLLTAIAAREVDPDDAYVYATEKKGFHKYVTDTSMLPKVDLTGPQPVTKPTSVA
jgi:twitching motility protein PilT